MYLANVSEFAGGGSCEPGLPGSEAPAHHSNGPVGFTAASPVGPLRPRAHAHERARAGGARPGLRESGRRWHRQGLPVRALVEEVTAVQRECVSSRKRKQEFQETRERERPLREDEKEAK